jgi:hypothetical protein
LRTRQLGFEFLNSGLELGFARGHRMYFQMPHSA